MNILTAVKEIGRRLSKPWRGVPLVIWLILGLLGLILAVTLIKEPKPWKGHGLEKLLAGKQLKLTECIPLGLWLGSALSLAAILVTALFLPLLARLTSLPAGANSAAAAIVPCGLGRRAIFTPLRLLGLAAMLLLALGLRLPSFPDGIHRDEQDTLRRNTFGYEEERKEGKFKFKKKIWSDVLWENGGANNPVFYSICSRLCLQAGWKIFDVPRDRFTITAVRLPSLIAGLLSIAAIWTLLMALEMPAPAWITSTLAAMHPMHIDYSAEGRGYGFVLFFTVLQILCLLPALRSGRWRWWAGYGLAQFLLLYSNPGSLYFPLVVNLYVIGILAWRWWTSRKEPLEDERILRQSVARGQLWRLLTANLVSALVFIQLMAPCIPQISNYFKITSVRGDMGPFWIFQVAAQYTTGLFLFLPDTPNNTPTYVSSYIKTEFTVAHAFVTPWIIYIMPVFLVLGLIALWRRGIFARLLVVCAVVPPILCYQHHALFTGLFLYYWYIIFSLPFLLIAWGTGMTLPFKSIASRLRPQATPPVEGEPSPAPNKPSLWRYSWLAVPIVLLPLYFDVTHEGRKQLRTGDGHPYVEILRGSYTWRVFPDGRMIRYLPKSSALTPVSNSDSSSARAEEGADAP